MKKFKFIAKSFGFGLTHVLISICICRLVEGIGDWFTLMSQAPSLWAVVLFFGALVLCVMIFIFIFIMGAIPLGVIEDYEKKLAEKEDKNDSHTGC